jgi:hypothetical protein
LVLHRICRRCLLKDFATSATWKSGNEEGGRGRRRGGRRKGGRLDIVIETFASE